MERKDLNIQTGSHGRVIIMGESLYNIRLYACTSGALMHTVSSKKSVVTVQI